jgi:cytochrome c551/c552
MNIDKKQEKKREENQDTQILLSKLAKDIAKDFNMNEKSARKFLKINISEGIEGIKDEIQKSQNEKLKSLKDEKLEKLLISIQ